MIPIYATLSFCWASPCARLYVRGEAWALLSLLYFVNSWILCLLFTKYSAYFLVLPSVLGKRFWLHPLLALGSPIPHYLELFFVM